MFSLHRNETFLSGELTFFPAARQLLLLGNVVGFTFHGPTYVRTLDTFDVCCFTEIKRLFILFIFCLGDSRLRGTQRPSGCFIL